MAYEGWIEFNETEIANAGRTVELSRAMGISAVRMTRRSTQWIEASFDAPGFGLGFFGVGPFGIGDGDEVDYRDVTEAPWYDVRYPASTEFAGFLPLDIRGLEGSTLEAETVEYITAGGHAGLGRHATLSIVADGMLVAKTERGAEYGLRWLNRVLRSRPIGTFCAGSDLTYFRFAEIGAPKAHRRDVRLTRGTSVTMKRVKACSALWRVTFTLTAGDPFEYGPPELMVQGLGGPDVIVNGPGGASPVSGSVTGLIEAECPAYDYTPVYDPTYPALVPSPTAPNFLPAGWNIEPGLAFRRYWARVPSLTPAALAVVPLITLTSTTEARRLRVSVWPAHADVSDQCDPLFSAVVNYLPPVSPFYVDGEQQASYTWDGFSPYVRRGDSLVFSPDAGPVEWATFTDPDELLVTLDVFEMEPGIFEGGGNVRMDLSFIPKSD